LDEQTNCVEVEWFQHDVDEWLRRWRRGIAEDMRVRGTHQDWYMSNRQIEVKQH
jgi:hypothetical protein